jgi:hypothetical protein
MGDEMRKLSRAAPAILLILAIACAANKAAYVSLGVTVHTVDVGMQLWANYVVANHPPAEKENQVRAAYKHYQDTARTLSVVLTATGTNPTPAELAAAANSLIALIESFTKQKVVVTP